ncbi:unnamed protein product [Polarella glacialis]|uniref:Ubiquitin-like domain-containing protein n=2 Tax=Polarella glacialis TaxID=89957 RepID=A0A813G9F0_POLGL|nr:unnamed protein product [Polarella glacialis]CAE8622899.1 unnamed protein product [Polarella glacialis]CAE8701536.1 unnamed protein product [Polarella glacialis]CAE8701538.1 unnamed protein product [Polarella glacialis]
MVCRVRMLPAVVLMAICAACLNFLPAFVGMQPALRASRNQVAMQVEWHGGLNRNVVEVFFTAPAQGERTRMVVTPDTTIDQILKDGRKLLGFDQEWIPDSDFTLYNGEDENTPLKGTIGECGLVDFGYEVHMYFTPK